VSVTPRLHDGAMPRTPASSSRVRSQLPLTEPLRHHRCEVARWALENGAALNLDALTVILGVRFAAHSFPSTSFDAWNTADVAALLWNEAAGLCLELEIELPSASAETLWTYLSFLRATGALTGSELAELRSELTAIAGLNRSGRLSHPAGTRRGGTGQVIELHRANDRVVIRR